MSSFFTLPASQRKRKRVEPGASQRPAKQSSAASQRPPKKRRDVRDESISGSDSGEDEVQTGLNGGDAEEPSDSDEDVAGRRTRLAEQYLENTRNEVLAEGFDAKDIDNELLAQRMGDRLRDDTAEGKGRIYRWIADEYDFAGARHTQFRADTLAMTGIATCYPFVYTVSKDMTLMKWEIPQHTLEESSATDEKAPIARSRKPKKLIYTRGNGKKAFDPKYEHHTADIICIAASSDGKFVATGGKDKKLIVWNAEDLKPLRVFAMHRDHVTSLCFRKGTNQLFSASKDRTIKIWSLDELAYVETLYGHQDEVLDIAALNEEKCVTVGARDRTARYWRVVEESQLVFRGGGSGSKRKTDDKGAPEAKSYNEGSIDRVAMIDDEMFVTGSDNGTLSLWNTQKKKAVFTLPLAHGVQPALKPEEASAEMHPGPNVVADPQPRWITALACLPFSNIVVSGSWDGDIRAWKVSEDKRRLEPLGPLGHDAAEANGIVDGEEHSVIGIEAVTAPDVETSNKGSETVRGVVNDIKVFERGDKGKDGLSVVAAIGKEHRLGRWLKTGGKNHAMLFDIPKRS